MNEIRRLLPLWAFEDLKKISSMIFVTGPRQVGKTFIARKLSDRYFNWDTAEVKKAFLKDHYFFRDSSKANKLVVFDEVHKRRDWKKLLKGYFDSPDREENFVVTGSGKFDTFRKGGDSLQGRYFPYKLYPLVYDEVKGFKKLGSPRDFKNWEPGEKASKNYQDDLLRLGGFPEVFLKGTDRYRNRWNDQYIQRLVYEDTRDFAAIKNLDKLELLARILPDRIMSPLSFKSIAEDLEVSPITIKSWIRLLETLYLGFSIPPFHRKIHRAVKKEKKWYFYQWSISEDFASSFENFMAVQLLAACSAWTEQGYGRYELFYLRDQDKREIDFLIAKNLVPQCLIEVKSSVTARPSSLEYYAKKLNIPAYLIYPDGPTKKSSTGYSISSAVFLDKLFKKS